MFTRKDFAESFSGWSVDFHIGDLPFNVSQLLVAFSLGSEADVPVSKFSVSVGEEVLEVQVQEGKYKTALFLLFLAGKCFPSTCEHCENEPLSVFEFVVSDEFRGLACVFFGPKLCAEAMESPEKHPALAMLLRDGASVTIELKSDQ